MLNRKQTLILEFSVNQPQSFDMEKWPKLWKKYSIWIFLACFSYIQMPSVIPHCLQTQFHILSITLKMLLKLLLHTLQSGPSWCLPKHLDSFPLPYLWLYFLFLGMPSLFFSTNQNLIGSRVSLSPPFSIKTSPATLDPLVSAFPIYCLAFWGLTLCF